MKQVGSAPGFGRAQGVRVKFSMAVTAVFSLAAVLVVGCSKDDGVVTPPPPGRVRTTTPSTPTTTTSTTQPGAGTTSTTLPTPPPGVTVRPAVERPNLIVVMTDDQTLASMKYLPLTRARFDKGGVTFDDSFTSYPLCCPSRATFVTGQFAHNHGVLWNSPPTGGYDTFAFEGQSVPAALRKAGYHTTHIGKYLNGYGYKNPTEVPPGWDNWQGLVDPSTGQYYGYTINDNGVLRSYGVTPPDAPDGWTPNPADYQTDVLTDRAVAEIGRASGSDKPFFLSLAYLAPHASFGASLESKEPGVLSDQVEAGNSGDKLPPAPVPAARHTGMFANEPVPRPPSFNEGDATMKQKPAVFQLAPLLRDDQIADLDTHYRAELESLQAVDEGVERIFTELERTGHADDTVVFFTSDNGYFHGEHRTLYGKYNAWEEGIRVPFLVSGPGVAEGAHSSTLVNNVDLPATLLDLSSAKPLRDPDGRSLRPVLANPATVWDRPVLIEAFAPPSPLRPQYVGVRTARYVYVEYSTGDVELYDIVADPFQLKNLAFDPASADLVLQGQQMLTDLRQCAGAECRDYERPGVGSP